MQPEARLFLWLFCGTFAPRVLVVFWVFVHTCAVAHPEHWLSFWVFVCRCVVVHPEHMPLKTRQTDHILSLSLSSPLSFSFLLSVAFPTEGDEVRPVKRGKSGYVP